MGRKPNSDQHRRKEYTTLQIDTATAKRAKVYSASRGQKINEYIRDLVYRDTVGQAIVFEDEL